MKNQIKENKMENKIYTLILTLISLVNFTLIEAAALEQQEKPMPSRVAPIAPSRRAPTRPAPIAPARPAPTRRAPLAPTRPAIATPQPVAPTVLGTSQADTESDLKTLHDIVIIFGDLQQKYSDTFAKPTIAQAKQDAQTILDQYKKFEKVVTRSFDISAINKESWVSWIWFENDLTKAIQQNNLEELVKAIKHALLYIESKISPLIKQLDIKFPQPGQSVASDTPLAQLYPAVIPSVLTEPGRMYPQISDVSRLPLEEGEGFYPTSRSEQMLEGHGGFYIPRRVLEERAKPAEQRTPIRRPSIGAGSQATQADLQTLQDLQKMAQNIPNKHTNNGLFLPPGTDVAIRDANKLIAQLELVENIIIKRNVFDFIPTKKSYHSKEIEDHVKALKQAVKEEHHTSIVKAINAASRFGGGEDMSHLIRELEVKVQQGGNGSAPFYPKPQPLPVYPGVSSAAAGKPKSEATQKSRVKDYMKSLDHNYILLLNKATQNQQEIGQILLNTSEYMFKEIAARGTAQDTAKVDELIPQLQQAINANDIAGMQNYAKQLKDLLHAIASDLLFEW